MTKHSNILTRLMFILFLIALTAPLVRFRFNHLFKEKELKGAVTRSERPAFNFSGWFNEDYQQKMETYLNQNFGFRNSLVRLHNQLSFWLFNKTNARDVIIGNENYLYELNYIRAYYGQDFIGDSLITERVHRLKTVQDTLNANGKLLVVVFAPGKGQFYPEYIPDHLKSEFSRTNYQAWKDAGEKAGLEILDFNAWFLQMKNNSEFPLYPKTGIHWSQYGVDLVIDSLIGFIENRTGLDLPDYIITERFLSTDYQEPDTDLEDGMNLIFPINDEPLAYSKFTINAEGKTKPRLMVISDSFYWPLFNKGISSSIFSEGEFWYYNQVIYNSYSDVSVPVSSVDHRKAIFSKDVVILIVTDANLPEFPWDFDNLAYTAISTDYEILQAEREARIRGYSEAILNSPEWSDDVRKKAAKNNITFEEQLRLDAIYMLENEGN